MGPSEIRYASSGIPNTTPAVIFDITPVDQNLVHIETVLNTQSIARDIAHTVRVFPSTSVRAYRTNLNLWRIFLVQGGFARLDPLPTHSNRIPLVLFFDVLTPDNYHPTAMAVTYIFTCTMISTYIQTFLFMTGVHVLT